MACYSMEMNKKGRLGIRELAERAKQEGAIDLAQGVVGVAPPNCLVEALQGINIGEVSRYDNKRGVLKFRQAAAQYLKACKWTVSEEQIMGTSGVTGATVAALLADLRPGDKVLLTEPFFYWP